MVPFNIVLSIMVEELSSGFLYVMFMLFVLMKSLVSLSEPLKVMGTIFFGFPIA
jgi:hypothetical protein